MTIMPTAAAVKDIRRTEAHFRDLTDCSRAMEEIAQIQIQLDAIKNDAEARIKPIRDVADQKAEPLNARLNRLATDVEEYMTNAYTDGVFDDGSRTMSFPHGECSFRQSPKSIVLAKKGKWTMEKVIEKIKSMRPGFQKLCLKTEITLNKKGILSRLDDIAPDELKECGLTVEQNVNFSIKSYTETATPSSQGRS